MALNTYLMWLPLLLIPMVLLLKKIKEVKTPKNHLPPSPPKLPMLGNLHQLGDLPHQSIMQLSQKYGPVMSLKFGRIPVVVISSAEAAREVLKVHDLDCCSRPHSTAPGKFTYNYLDIAYAPYGGYWREMRKIWVLELFSSKRVQSFQFIMEEEVASLMNSISQSSSSSTSVDLSRKLFSFTGSIVFRIAFGQTFEGGYFDNHKFGELFHEAKALLGSFTAEEYFPYVGWIIDKVTGYHVKLDRASKELDMFFEQVISNHLKFENKIQEQEDIIDVLLKIQRNQSKSGEAWFTSKSIKAILWDIFLAAVDTTADTVIWAMAELARNSRVMSTAQDEIRNYIGKKGRVTEGDIDKFPYLRMIIKETLRLHPPAPLLLPRQAISHFKVDGFDIYPKTLIQVNIWAIGRDPKYWKKPEEFYPERFVDTSIDFKGQNFDFLPFGSGRRICPGIQLGVITTELALANLLYCFDWKLPNGMKKEDLNMEERVGMSLTVSKRTNLNLVPVKYLQ